MPAKKTCEALTPRPQNGSFMEVIKLNMKSLGWALIHRDRCPNKNRVQSDAAQREGHARHRETTATYKPKDARGSRKPGERHGAGPPFQPSTAANVHPPLDLGLLDARTVRPHTSGFMPPSLWYFITAAN